MASRWRCSLLLREPSLLLGPVTLVVTAVALGASAGLTDTASSAIKDAYAGLKGLLSHRQVDVSAIERRPDSIAQRDALQETLTDNPEAIDRELLDAAEQVTDAVAVHRPDAADVIGVDLTDVRAGFVRVRSISSSGSGFRGVGLTVDGGIDMGTGRQRVSGGTRTLRSGRPAHTYRSSLGQSER
jgi:hypothetical protein